MLKRMALSALLAIGALAATSHTAAAQSVGVKGGLVFPEFDADNLDIDNRTGWQGGLFFGGNPGGVLGLQSEINFIRKKAETSAPGSLTDLTVDYVQLPVLLRLHSPASSASSVQLYGLIGPSVELKVRESIEGTTVSSIKDGFEGFTWSGIIGAGVEAGRIIVEGRYTRGFREVNKNFLDTTEIKGHSFAVLVGLRLN